MLDNNRGTSLQHPARRRDCARARSRASCPHPPRVAAVLGKPRAPLLALPSHPRGAGTPEGAREMGAEICPRFPQVHDSGRLGHIPAQPPFPCSLRLANTESEPATSGDQDPQFYDSLKNPSANFFQGAGGEREARRGSAGGTRRGVCLRLSEMRALSRNLNALSETRKSQRLPHAMCNSYSQELGMHRALPPLFSPQKSKAINEIKQECPTGRGQRQYIHKQQP